MPLNKAIFSGGISLHSPYIGLIYDGYLQFRFLKWSLISWVFKDSLMLSSCNGTVPIYSKQRLMCGCVWKRKGDRRIVAILIGKLTTDGEPLDLEFSFFRQHISPIP